MKTENSLKEKEELLNESEQQKNVNKTYKTHPDGGWGWIVVIAAFSTQFVVLGLQNSSGVIFNELVEQYNETRGETGTLIKSILAVL